MLKITLITSLLFLTGCSTMMCYGTGTCHKDANGSYITDPAYYAGNGYTNANGATSSTGTYNRGAVITTSSGNIVVVPSASGPYPAAILRSGK